MRETHHPFFNYRSLPLFLALGLCAIGCRKETVQTYEVPKESEPTAPAMSSGALPPSHPPIDGSASAAPARPQLTYDIPEGWHEQTASQMQAASFVIHGEEGEEANVTVIPLPDIMSQELEVVNIWRDELKLERATQESLPDVKSEIKIGEDTGWLYDMVSEVPVHHESKPSRITVAVLSKDGLAWFFKLSGTSSLVGSQQEAFKEFLSSVEIQPASQPSMTRAPSTSTGPAPSQPALDLETPDHWQPEAPGNFVLASYAIPGGDGGQAKVTVSSLAGTAGGILPNVNRWLRQIGQPPAGEARLQEIAKPFEFNSGGGHLIDISGETSEFGPTRMIVAMISSDGSTWFYKLMGGQSVVEAEKEAFLEYVNSR